MDFETTLSNEERMLRVEIVKKAKDMILRTMHPEVEDDDSFMIRYGDFYLQITFSPLHPLVILHYVRSVPRPILKRDYESINMLNVKSVLGGHALDSDMGCYIFRITQWLDSEVKSKRFSELLMRGSDEAVRAYTKLFADR